ncbi:hypothetical protein [Nocardia testacea]|uniref:hypothetical protein n=1 Tax=Nocardia testacea TaxID=248551 RepID=UPI003A8A16C9
MPRRATREPGAVDETFPVLSTQDRRAARMTQLLPGRPVGRFTGRLWAKTLLAAALWALVFSVPCAAFLELAPTTVGSPWAFGLTLISAYVAVNTTLGLVERIRAEFGQVRLPGLLASTTIWGALSLTALAWLAAGFATEPEPAFDLRHIATATSLPRELLALLAATAGIWAVSAAIRLAHAFGHARSRQQTIERLRRTGTRHAGALAERDHRGSWLFDKPEFRIQIAYDDHGRQRLVPAFMRTRSTQVPVVGSAVVIFTDEADGIHIDLDRSSGVEYEADHRRFEPSDG